MKKRLRTLWVPLVITTLVAGCGGDDTMEPEPPAVEPPPNLSGTYDLQSVTQSGLTLGAPPAMGTFVVSQTSSSGDTASGTMSYNVSIPDFGIMLADEGTYTIRTDGSWQQNGTEVQALGTYTLAGNVLTVMVTEPAVAVSTTVWRRQ
ncbi:hypothetical protein [Candidatus Palauibacter sp.]|uniref:hypothetical protein n=1 Tax=Candidatus Palauibacter sp. TaxID=3101350 RepID=UPI003B012CAA